MFTRTNELCSRAEFNTAREPFGVPSNKSIYKASFEYDFTTSTI